MFLLKLMLKIITLPFVLSLTLAQWIAILITSVSTSILNILLGIVSVIVMSSWMMGLTSEGNMLCGLVVCGILFLLPQLAKWCILGVVALKCTLMDFIRA